MDKGRKRTILIAASILVARKSAQLEKNSPAMESAIAETITLAERIMLKIDNRWSAPPDQRMNSWEFLNVNPAQVINSSTFATGMLVLSEHGLSPTEPDAGADAESLLYERLYDFLRCNGK